ncbi:IDEAL domain-containing protein [Guptibacillus hwajinpoensis]|uniref:IDEAL domain-containing protein n=1 Tax=Guptibacillus hwajinpoensis TaxID=208199 RepID=UPI001CD806DE|nr:IDEAL domain-containing protein [Pseudalkalibacillus hwajinpoensis]MCA0993732.1 IDEAL domain-containing protein [Pseudalkalibacillus hwajinpoensis]
MENRKVYQNQISEKRQEMVAQLLEHINASSIEQKQDILKKEIDEALDCRDRETFMQLTDRLNSLT